MRAVMVTLATKEFVMIVTTSSLTKKSLSVAQQKFVELLQRIRHGRIPLLQVRCGLPVLQSDLCWRRKVKVLGENAPHPSLHSADFPLRKDFVSFFALLASLGDADIVDLEVRNGLPFCFDVIERLPA
jgi:hypothetical protein